MWRTDLDWSSVAFQELVWPILQQEMGGRLVPVETVVDSGFAKDLDTLAGIDAWNLLEGGIRGIASRVQVCPKTRPYNTFTVRRQRNTGTITEYEKRLLALKSDQGLLYPHVTVQAYVTEKVGGELISFGWVTTRSLYEYIEQNMADIEVNNTTNANFFVVPFREVAEGIYSGEKFGYYTF